MADGAGRSVGRLGMCLIVLVIRGSRLIDSDTRARVAIDEASGGLPAVNGRLRPRGR